MPCSVRRQISPLLLPCFGTLTGFVVAAVGKEAVVAVAGSDAAKVEVLDSESATDAELENHHHLHHPPLGIVRYLAYQTLTWTLVVPDDKTVFGVGVPVCPNTPVEMLKKQERELRTGTYYLQFLRETVQGV